MANYSKEAERQNKALKDLMQGKEYEKDYVQVGYEGEKPENLGGKTRESELQVTTKWVNHYTKLQFLNGKIIKMKLSQLKKFLKIGLVSMDIN